MSTTRKSISLAILAACLLPSKTAEASLVAITAPNSVAGVFGPSTAATDVTAGYEFQVGPLNLLVSSLGIWDDSLTVGGGGGGLLAAASVGIWDTTAGNPLLVSTPIPTGTGGTVIGDYRYASVTPTILLAGHDYIAGAYVLHNLYHGSSNSASDVTFGTPNVNFVERVASAPGFIVPTGTLQAGASAWDAPNFQFVALPEPTSLALGVITMLGLVVRRLIRRG